MQSNDNNFGHFNANQNANHLIGGQLGSLGPTPSLRNGSGFAPPLPPRPTQSMDTMYRTGGFGGVGYGGYGGGQYGGYSPMYSPNGLSGFGGAYGCNRMNPYMGFNSSDNDLMRIADQRSRQAFQSIESLVQAFGSVSMMLETSLYTIQTSFRAFIGVADNFSRLRQHLQHILSTLAVVRSLKWIITKILSLIGVRLGHQTDNPSEKAWSQASGQSNPIESHLTADGTFDSLKGDNPSKPGSALPIVLFFTLIVGTPWLLYRLLASIAGNDMTASEKWATGEEEHYEAVALYDFHSDLPRELSFTVNQKIIVAPKELQPRVRGWLLASIDGQKVGLIPANYVKILGSRNPKAQQ